MPRPRGELHKVFLQREGNDFVALVDDIAEYRKWKEGDTSIPLANFAQFKVYDTHKLVYSHDWKRSANNEEKQHANRVAHNRQGAQGILDEASRATLHSSFGTENEENCLKSILHDGSVQTTQVRKAINPTSRICDRGDLLKLSSSLTVARARCRQQEA